MENTSGGRIEKRVSDVVKGESDKIVGTETMVGSGNKNNSAKSEKGVED